ncbi:MAG TPA: hypothetical protein VFW25_07710 [Silvibacterium sp.]|nr:hypothetical protein [Silvibacterium sp.]
MVNVVCDLEKTIDPKKSNAGDPVTAKVSEDATLSDGTKLAAGSVLTGKIDSITPSENKRDSTLTFTLNKVTTKEGKTIWVKAVVVGVASYTSTFGQELAAGTSEGNRSASSSATTNTGSGMNGQGGPSKGGPHYIKGLTLSGSPNAAASATLTQAGKNIHLTNNTQLIVSVAQIPAS